MDDFELELKQGFLEEAAQLLTDAEQCFLSLESSESDPGILEKIFRLAHNFKGSAKAVGFNQLSTFSHEFENFLLKIKNKELTINQMSITLLLECNDFLKVMVDGLKQDLNAVFQFDELIEKLKNPPQSDAVTENETPSASPVSEIENTEAPVPETQVVEVNQELLAQALLETQTPAPIESLEKTVTQSLPPDSAMKQSQSQIQKKVIQSNADESIRVSLNKLEKLINFVGELVILQTVLKEQSHKDNFNLLRKSVHQLGKVTQEVQEISMSLRMIPVKQTFQKMQRIVRDTAAQLGKKIQLHLSGEETELDKIVLESLSDPLVHLIRNAVDHGIESEEDRVKNGKNPIGNVYLNAFHESGKLVIQVKDDGGGISAEKLRKKAFEKGILKSPTALTDQEAVHLIFHPGFSTKEQVSEVSGRGVGMDVVKTNIESLQGEVTVDTKLGIGTTFKVILPLTLAIIDAMVIQLRHQRYVIPLAHVHESLRPTQKDIQESTQLGSVLLLRGENIPMFRLDHLLGYPKNQDLNLMDCIALVIRTQEKPFAILVDDILGQHQVVIKKLGVELNHLKGFSGSAVLGDGRPALILELNDLIQNSSGSKQSLGNKNKPSNKGAAA